MDNLRYLRVSFFAVVLGVSLFGLAACGSSATVPDEIAEVFDVEGQWIADLTDPGDEQFNDQLVLSSIGQARALGTELRVAVVGSQDERPSPQAIVDVYGGTALVYKANDSAFFAHSADMSNEQVAEAAEGLASDQPTISDSVNGFVQSIGQQGLSGRSLFDTLLRFVLLPLAALFMLFMLYRYVVARNAAKKRTANFEDRKQSLGQWAGQLPDEVNSLRGAVALSSDASRSTLAEIEELSNRIPNKIAAAETMADLDAAEMRLGREFIKLRELRKAVQI